MPSGAPPTPEAFAEAAAGILSDAGASQPEGSGDGVTPAPAAAPENLPPEDLSFELGGVQVTINRESIVMVLGTISKAIADGLNDPDWELKQWEYDLWVPAAQYYLNKLPELLKRAGSPGIALLLAAVGSYIIARPDKILFPLMRLLKGEKELPAAPRKAPAEPTERPEVISAPASRTADSAASRVSSAAPEPESLTVHPSFFSGRSGESGTTPLPT